jgi:hypothetical protein
LPEASVFEWVSTELETRARLSRLEARGTVRLVLRNAGLDPATVRAHQMHVVVNRLLPGALAKRGVEGADALCQAIAAELLAKKQETTITDTAYDVFERLDADEARRRT